MAAITMTPVQPHTWKAGVSVWITGLSLVLSIIVAIVTVSLYIANRPSRADVKDDLHEVIAPLVIGQQEMRSDIRDLRSRVDKIQDGQDDTRTRGR